MMGKNWKLLGLLGLYLAALSLTASASVTDPNIISGAFAVNGTAPEALVVVKGALAPGQLPFVDRTVVFGDANDLGGLDYVQTAVDDKNDPDVEYHVTVDKAGTLFLIIDNRVGDENKADPPTLGSGIMDWVITDGFTQTLYKVNTSEPATVYAKSVTAGTYVLGAQYNGNSRVMYVVAAAPDGWNFAPTIDGVPESVQVAPGSTLAVDSTINDDGIPGTGVSVQWTTLSKPDGATVGYSPNDTSEDVTISFSEMGAYTLQISASDGEKTRTKTLQVSVQIPTFALQATDHCMICNDSNTGPDSTRRTSISDIKNYNDGTNQRRRIGFYQYNLSGLKEAGEVFADSYLTWNVDKWSNPAGKRMYVYAVKEDIDQVTLNGLTWNTAPGVDNTPAPEKDSEITIDTLDPADLSPLVMASGVSTLDVWENTATFAGLDEILNADTDGILTLMFVAYDPESNGYEVCSPTHSRSLTIDGTAYKGIILRGNIMNPTWATQPVPAINTSQSTNLTQLSWTNPPAVGNLTCDVWIGTGEPNDVIGSGDGFTQIANDVTGNTASLAGYPLTIGTTYNWVVNVTDDGTGVTTRGYTWSFNTNNAYPVVTMEKDYQYLWLNNNGDPASATAVINATVTDDGVPNPTQTLQWVQISGPAVTINPDNVEDITLILPEVGTYVFQLSANDGDLVGTGSTQIFVGATPCEAAKEKPGYEPLAGDFDNNCYVDLNDFSTFAQNWLECHPFMDAPCAP